MRIRTAGPEDREAIRAILCATDFFMEDELNAAMSLVDEAIDHPEKGEYFVDVLEGDDRRLIGYVCWGPVPQNADAYDLYWIAVAPESQKRGHGRMLLSWVESRVVARGGSLLMIETSTRESYAPTRRFYERNGYTEMTRILDFKRTADDRVVFARELR